jgi:hypothetical protein
VTASYTSTAKALHWLMAILFFGLLALGFYMHDLPLSPEKLKLYSWHKWAGVSASCSSGSGWPGASRIGRPPCRRACPPRCSSPPTPATSCSTR